MSHSCPSLPCPFPRSWGCRVHATEKGRCPRDRATNPIAKGRLRPCLPPSDRVLIGFSLISTLSRVEKELEVNQGLEECQFIPVSPAGLPHLVHKVSPCTLNTLTPCQAAGRIFKSFRPQIDLSGEVQVRFLQSGTMVQHWPHEAGRV